VITRVLRGLVVHRRLVAGLCVAGLIAFAAVVWFVGGSLVAPNRFEVGEPPADPPTEEVALASASGARLAGWYAERDGAYAALLLLHGLRASRRQMSERAQLLHAAGFATLAIDLQGHGESEGDAITAGWRERDDVRAAVGWLREREPGRRLGLIGISLGGAATLLAGPRADGRDTGSTPLAIDALVLESVYPTIDEAVHARIDAELGPLAHLLAPALLTQFELRLSIDTDLVCPIDHIAACGAPVLLLVGNQDLGTPLPQSLRLFETARDPKALIVFDGAGHVDLCRHDRELWEREVLAFLREHLDLP